MANGKKTVETLKHDEATRKNIPTAEYQSVMKGSDESPLRVAYERRNQDLDPQLVWKGKDRAGLVRPRCERSPPLHPGEGPSQGPHR